MHRKQRLVVVAIDKGEGIALPVGRCLERLALRHPVQASSPVDGTVIAILMAGLIADPPGQHLLIDVDAAALAGQQITLVHQLLVGQDHSIARHTQLGRQLAGRGQAPTGHQAAHHDRFHDFLAQLALQAEWAVRVQVEHGPLRARVSPRR